MLAAGCGSLCAILALAQYRPFKRVIEFEQFVFLVTNVSAMFLVLDANSPDESVTRENEPVVKMNFQFSVCLYTWYVVLHHLTTNWAITWWVTLAALAITKALLYYNYSALCEPLSQPWYVLLLVLFFASSYLTERKQLRGWLNRHFLV